MPKLDALLLAPVEAPSETRAFTDAAQPGQTLTLTLKRPDFPDYAAAQSISAALAALWVPKEGKFAPRFPPPPHQPIRWSERLCEILGLLEAIQCPADPGDAYDALELAVLSVRMPNAWVGVLGWLQELERETLPGNPRAACEAPSSAPLATKEEPTPPSTST